MQIQQHLRQIPVKDVKPSKANTRQFGEPDDALKALSRSIVAEGLVQPITVRESEPGKYIIIAGERRWRAHKLAKLETIQCLVREEVENHDVLTVVENLHRQDLSPMEESLGVQQLIDSGRSHKSIASELGQSATWVARRAHLTKLTDQWKEAVTKKHEDLQSTTSEDAFARWPIGHLEEVAKLGDDAQDRIYRHYSARTHVPELKDLNEKIGELTRKLGKAPFDLNDAELVPDAGACTVCPMRQGANSDLFGINPDISVPVNEDICQNKDCFEMKLKRYGSKRFKEEKAKVGKDVKLLRLQEMTDYYGEHNGYKCDKKQYALTKKSEGNAHPGVVVSGRRLGLKVYVAPVKEEEEQEVTSENLEQQIEWKEKRVKQAQITALNNAAPVIFQNHAESSFFDPTNRLILPLLLAIADKRPTHKATEEWIGSTPEAMAEGIHSMLFNILDNNLLTLPEWKHILGFVGVEKPAISKMVMDINASVAESREEINKLKSALKEAA